MCRSTRSGSVIFDRLLVVARMFAVLGCLQLSGISHAMTDALAELGVVETHSDDCDDEAPGQDCPPGCPSCHCSDCGIAAIPPVARGELTETLDAGEALPILDKGRAPSTPYLPALYRPPRSLLVA